MTKEQEWIKKLDELEPMIYCRYDFDLDKVRYWSLFEDKELTEYKMENYLK